MSGDAVKEEFEEAIARLLRRFRGRLDPGDAARLLNAAANALDVSPDKAGVSFDPVTSTLHMVFEDANELEARLPELLELRAVVVKADVPLHHELIIRVSFQGRAVELAGRVVQEIPTGKCIQIDRVEQSVESRLRELPESEESIPDEEDLFGSPQTGVRRRQPFVTPIPNTTSAAEEDTFERRPPTLAQHKPLRSPSRSWPLNETPLEQTILELVANNATGMLELVGPRRRLILIDRGTVIDVGADPENPEESLEALLRRSKTIDDDDVERVRAYRTEFGVGSSEALLNLGIVEWNDLQIGLRTRARFLLRDIWDYDADAHFFPLEKLPSKPMAKPVRLLNLVFSRRVDAIKAGDELMGGLSSHLIRKSDTIPPVLKTLDLLPQHDDILDIPLATGRGLNEIVRLSRSTSSEAKAAVETLLLLGFLESAELRPISRVHTQSVRQILMLHARISTENHFDVFGLHWSAYDEEISVRYDELKSKFDTALFDDAMTPELEEKLLVVGERVDEAWRVLKDRRKRRNHRMQIVDDFQIENSIHMFESQADTAVFRRDIPEAVGFFSRILELDSNRSDIREKLRQIKEFA